MERMDEHRMARRVLMAEVDGGYTMETEVSWMDGEDGLGQERNDGRDSASMLERSERVESPDTYVTE